MGVLYTTVYTAVETARVHVRVVSDIAIFVLKRDVKLQLTNMVVYTQLVHGRGQYRAVDGRARPCAGQCTPPRPM